LERDKGKSVTDHKKYWVYIVASCTGTLYLGMTNNLYVRVGQHKSGEIEGFSSKYHCNRLVYWESFDDVLKAIDREKQLKGWRRGKKIVLIESMNRRWQDLAEKWGAEMAFDGQSIVGRRAHADAVRQPGYRRNARATGIAVRIP
jgi:putative endonuclease